MSTAEMSTAPVPKSRSHLRWLVVCGAVVILAAVGYREYFLARPVGVGAAGPTVSQADFQRVWTARPVVLLGLGDSVTQGLGASPGMTYFQRLAKNPANEFPEMRGVCLSAVFPKLESENLAISGTTSIECVDYQLPKLVPYPPDVFGVVVITTGGNDVIHNYGRTPAREGAMYGARVSEIAQWVTNFDQRLETIVRRVRETFPGGCQIFIANIYDPSDGDGDIQNAGLPPRPDGLGVLAAYNGVLAKFAERHADVQLVDMHSLFLGHGIHCRQFWHRHYQASDPHYWYWDNLEDPNDRGYDALRRQMLIEMARVLPEKLKGP